jgi:hypothetical protein
MLVMYSINNKEPQHNERGSEAVYQAYTAGGRTEIVPIKQGLRFHVVNATKRL